MEEWKEYKLGDIYEVHNGLSKGGKFFGSGYPFLSFSTIFNNWFIPAELSNLVQSTDKEQESYSIKEGDVFITRTSETADELGMSCVALKDYPKATYNGFCKRMRQYNHNIEVLPKYIGYYLRNPNFRLYFQAFSGSMSTRASLTNEALLGLTVKLPPLPTQQKIAAILSSLDDKIELNNKINTNLEQQAQAILLNTTKQNNYKEVQLSEIAELNPDSYTSNDNWEYVNYLDTSSITNNIISDVQYINLTDEKLPSRAKRKIRKNDIVYSTVRPNQHHFGLIKTLLPNMLVSTGFTVIRSKNPEISNEYLYLELTKSDVIEKLQQIAEQSVSTFPSVKPSDIGNCNVKVFQNNIADKLNNQLSSIYSKIANNDCENKQLSIIRDTLLPKLMNGEIEV